MRLPLYQHRILPERGRRTNFQYWMQIPRLGRASPTWNWPSQRSFLPGLVYMMWLPGCLQTCQECMMFPTWHLFRTQSIRGRPGCMTSVLCLAGKFRQHSPLLTWNQANLRKSLPVPGCRMRARFR